MIRRFGRQKIVSLKPSSRRLEDALENKKCLLGKNFGKFTRKRLCRSLEACSFIKKNMFH